MRTKLALLPALFALGCNSGDSAPTIDHLEMRVSGDNALDIRVDQGGEGEYHLSRPLPGGTTRSFSIRPQQFTAMLQRLEPFRAQSVSVTDKSLAEVMEAGEPCPKNAPYVMDAGTVWVRWVGPTSDKHYLADLGCDPRRNAARNAALLAVVESLPAPPR